MGNRFWLRSIARCRRQVTRRRLFEDSVAVGGDEVVEGVGPRLGENFQDQNPSGRGGEFAGGAEDSVGFYAGVAGVDEDEAVLVGDGVLGDEGLALIGAEGNEKESAGRGVAGEVLADAGAEDAVGVDEDEERLGGGR